MFQYIDELSIVDVMQSMTLVLDPFVKSCRLCRTRRIYALEHRLLHDQVPPNMLKGVYVCVCVCVCVCVRVGDFSHNLPYAHSL